MKVWITSDSHFDHRNILFHCHRPFSNVEEMNDVISNNWNETVAKEDLVYFLGDLEWSRKDWLSKLNGRIQWIRGNHDKDQGHGRQFLPRFVFLRHSDISFMLIHDPDDECVKLINDPKMWVIAGHHHNNYPDVYPFFDYSKRRINVSVEMTEYKPVLFMDLVNRIKTLDTI
jgi:calcineurin-like phosphoesterase family protein